MKQLFGALALICIFCPSVQAGPEEAHLKTAQIIYKAAAGQSADVQHLSYQQVREILDRIVADYPSSDIAVRILLEDNLDGLDVAALEASLEAYQKPVATKDQENEAALSVPELQQPDAANNTVGPSSAVEIVDMSRSNEVATPETGSLIAALPPLRLDTPTRSEKEIVADVQAELNRLGCNAGSADGVAGRNTRNAFKNFINDSGSTLTADDLATESALAELKSQEGTICEIRTMATTTASSLSGSWGFQGDCPGLGNRVIRNKGRMTLRYTGNNTLSGTAKNQNGNSGPAVIQFQGTRTAATRIKLGFFTLAGNLTRSTRNMTISGTGTRRCKITLWKN